MPLTRLLPAGLLAFALCAAQAQSVKPPASESATAPAPAVLPEPSTSARDLFSRYKDRLLQVRNRINHPLRARVNALRSKDNTDDSVEDEE